MSASCTSATRPLGAAAGGAIGLPVVPAAPVEAPPAVGPAALSKAPRPTLWFGGVVDVKSVSPGCGSAGPDVPVPLLQACVSRAPVRGSRSDSARARLDVDMSEPPRQS